jgi:hypothetical protein
MQHQRVIAGEAAIAVRLQRSGVFVREDGEHVFTLHDAAGKLVERRVGMGGTLHAYAGFRNGRGLEPGVYVVTIRTGKGSFVRQISLL